MGARPPFGHPWSLHPCIAPIRAPSGLSGGLSVLASPAGRARTMCTSAQAPLRRSQSPAGVAGAWTHPNDYLRPHTGSQWALRGRWSPVLGLGHGLLRGRSGLGHGVSAGRVGGVTGAQAGLTLGGSGRVRKKLCERLRVRTRRAGGRRRGAHQWAQAGAPV